MRKDTVFTVILKKEVILHRGENPTGRSEGSKEKLTD